MALRSNLLADSVRLNSCLTLDASHVKKGDVGEYVGLIQTALIYLDDSTINNAEIALQQYGTTTAAAVLAYKRKRNIINKAYQNTADDIVGKMTIKSIDDELVSRQFIPKPSYDRRCAYGLCSCNQPDSSRAPPTDVPRRVLAAWAASGGNRTV